ncbi:hypothetical protein ACIHJG_39815 [Streptomyces sp. NPDC052415]|uniref:hypothetical protein n=1 Tax=Streptomyces sp. NPDC052415 TaxID=3365690 RepID=UPI0037D6D21A
MAVSKTDDGIHLEEVPWQGSHFNASGDVPELVDALNGRNSANGRHAQFTGQPEAGSAHIDSLCRRVLAMPRSPRWREAVSTALLGDWDEPLWQTGHLAITAIGALRAEARSIHRGLVPVWRRRTRAGRVLSLDAGLGDGLSLHDMVASDVDLLAHTAGGIFEDERLNAVLRGLNESERRVVFAYAEGEGTTWAEAAAAIGSMDPYALGEPVRRKTKRLAAEQRRRAEQRRCRNGAPSLPQDSLLVGRSSRTGR